ncbi:hypothetical protein JX265_000677 [Neoarthrinium moseri]|uniref:Uncharacterized protein n=1 Tax=Neoarthrinium moseri TaxID=1658444 RepID=A0A9Q0AVU2_9PEZI|nr:hypothetical protein JX265_000677 [Neoarthrinium moseri]
MASLSVAGKYAIITGGGSGINLAFARLLLSRGCSVLIGDLNLRPEAQQLLSEYPYPPASSRPSAQFHPTDVRSWPQLSALFNKGLSSFPRLDIVCPGAGLFEPRFSNFWHPPRTGTNPDTPSRDIAADVGGDGCNTYATLDVNLTHPIRLSQLAIGYWTQQRAPGCLVHVSSIAGQAASIGTPLYFASKHGLSGFTPMWEEDPHKAAMLDQKNDLLIDPKEIAEAMLQLCENPEYGDGTILEVLIAKQRVVPTYNADRPSGKGVTVPGYAKAEEELMEGIKNNGLKT